MNIFPLLVGSPAFKANTKFLSHNFWVPFARLSYGAFLSHAVFMQFREYNVERGQWGCAFDAILMFLAYLTFSFLFSLWMAITFDFPLQTLYYEFLIKQ